jgi:hypothetical protein
VERKCVYPVLTNVKFWKHSIRHRPDGADDVQRLTPRLEARRVTAEGFSRSDHLERNPIR